MENENARIVEAITAFAEAMTRAGAVIAAAVTPGPDQDLLARYYPGHDQPASAADLRRAAATLTAVAKECKRDGYPADAVALTEIAARVEATSRIEDRGGYVYLQSVIGQARDALRTTREYVQPKVNLPALPGWSWYDAYLECDRALQDDTTDDLHLPAGTAPDTGIVEPSHDHPTNSDTPTRTLTATPNPHWAQTCPTPCNITHIIVTTDGTPTSAIPLSDGWACASCGRPLDLTDAWTTTDNQPPRLARCQSCGQRATVHLDDGSDWCTDCDASARRLGYDDGTSARAAAVDHLEAALAAADEQATGWIHAVPDPTMNADNPLVIPLGEPVRIAAGPGPAVTAAVYIDEQGRPTITTAREDERAAAARRWPYPSSEQPALDARPAWLKAGLADLVCEDGSDRTAPIVARCEHCGHRLALTCRTALTRTNEAVDNVWRSVDVDDYDGSARCNRGGQHWPARTDDRPRWLKTSAAKLYLDRGEPVTSTCVVCDRPVILTTAPDGGDPLLWLATDDDAAVNAARCPESPDHKHLARPAEEAANAVGRNPGGQHATPGLNLRLVSIEAATAESGLTPGRVRSIAVEDDQHRRSYVDLLGYAQPVYTTVPDEDLALQVKRLADAIVALGIDEPSESEGAVDVAIRLLRWAYATTGVYIVDRAKAIDAALAWPNGLQGASRAERESIVGRAIEDGWLRTFESRPWRNS